MSQAGRAYVLNEATYRQVLDLKPNVAVLPWGATEAHNYHLPHGTDAIEGTTLGEAIVAKANGQGARCLLLPTVPFGNDNTQLPQAATITMRSQTQQMVLRDVAMSLVEQGIDRLVVLNAHGGNNFTAMIRDIVLELPIFIVQATVPQLAPQVRQVLTVDEGDHANEFETSLLLHLRPQWVAPLETAGDGAATPFALPALKAPGVWVPRLWSALTKDTGVGDPRHATAEKGRKIFQALTDALVPVLVQLSAAKEGDFPYVIRK